MTASEFEHAALVVLVLAGSIGALVGLGFAWGRFRSLAVLSVLCVIAAVVSDVLYFGFGINLIG